MFTFRTGIFVLVTIVVLIQIAESKENLDSDICADFMDYLKKHAKQKKDDETEKDSGEKKPNKLKKLEEQIEKYFEKKFPWWPKQQIEELDVTEKPKPTANPLEGFLTSYMDLSDLVSYLFKMI